jgi:membrane protease subunit (stomatin/prohibitin family)
MNMVGDMGRYTQYQVAQSIPIAAANEGGGGVGVGAGLGAGMALGQAMADAVKKASADTAASGGAAAATKFCQDCGKAIPRATVRGSRPDSREPPPSRQNRHRD